MEVERLSFDDLVIHEVAGNAAVGVLVSYERKRLIDHLHAELVRQRDRPVDAAARGGHGRAVASRRGKRNSEQGGDAGKRQSIAHTHGSILLVEGARWHHATRETSMGAGRWDVLNLGSLVWNVPSVAARLSSVASRCDADVALEDPREVALVGEPGLLRDRGDARVAAA